VNVKLPGFEAAFHDAFVSAPPRAAVRRHRILVIEDDVNAAHSWALALRLEAFDVVAAHSGFDGLAAARGASFDLLIVDLRLPDISGLDVVRALRADEIGVPFIVVTGFTPLPTVMAAMRLGASTILEKPVDLQDFLLAVRTSIRPAPAPPLSEPPLVRPRAADTGAPQRWRSTTERWAVLVFKVMDSARDPKTMDDWARAVSVSRSMLSECCRLVRVSPHAARDFARVARAIRQSGARWQPEAVMDIADTRTLQKLLRTAGLIGVTTRPTFVDFVERQQWIPIDNPALAALRSLVASEEP
jgi:DNA-binding response OmpR family regulator